METIQNIIAEIDPANPYTDDMILRLRDKDGWTIAHHMAKKGCTFQVGDPILLLETPEGLAVRDVC